MSVHKEKSHTIMKIADIKLIRHDVIGGHEDFQNKIKSWVLYRYLSAVLLVVNMKNMAMDNRQAPNLS